jgi:uncharacterized OB-fold protein
MAVSPVKIWRRQKEIRSLLHQRGNILSWTVIYAPSDEFKKNAPYTVVLVEFNNGDRAFGQLVECETDKVRIGMPVYSTLRKVREVSHEDVIAYGLKFKPSHHEKS